MCIVENTQCVHGSSLYHQQAVMLHAECQARLHANLANSRVGFSKKRAPVVHAMKNHQPHAHSWQNVEVRESFLNQHVSIWHTNQPAKSKSCANSREMEERQIATKWRGSLSGIDSEWWNARNPIMKNSNLFRK